MAITIGQTVTDLFGRACEVLELKDTFDTDGNAAVLATIKVLPGYGNFETTFQQNADLLKPKEA